MTPSPLIAALLARCPRCGTGKLFRGLMTVAPQCPACSLPLSAQDSGDGPMFFVLVIAGFLTVGLAAWVEIRYAPPLWLHALLWVPFTFIACIALLRFFKAWLIALQFRHHPETFV